MLTAQAEFNPSEIQDLADAIPRLLEMRAKANVPLRFLVRLELGDGTNRVDPGVAAEINQILLEVKASLGLS